MRICAACDSTKTYVEKDGLEHWRSYDGYTFCNTYYCKYIRVQSKQSIQIRNARKIRFGRLRVYLNTVVRKGICSRCGGVKGKDCNQTSIHHWFYLIIMPWACTVELCQSCHMKEHVKLRHAAF